MCDVDKQVSNDDGGCVLGCAAHAHRLHQGWGGVLRRLSAHAAMCALGIDKLRQHPAEILLLGRHAEHNALGAHVPVRSLDIGHGETQLDLSRWILLGSRVQRESGLSSHGLAPTRGFELYL